MPHSCPEARKAYHREYARKNRERIRKHKSKWNKNNTKYFREKYHNDVNHRLAASVRNRLNRVISSGRAMRHLGCTIEELKLWLESQFETGMTWDNRSEWHIDHILPLAEFDLSNSEERDVACHFTNLQPLWAADNLEKGTQLCK